MDPPSERRESDALEVQTAPNFESVTGVQVSYYVICRTKLWLFSRRMDMEREHENVRVGRELNRFRYPRARKDIPVGSGKYDFVRTGDILEVHDIKKSKSFDEAHRLQLLYYLYRLAQGGVRAVGVLDYPLTNRHERIEPTAEAFAEVEEALAAIPTIVRGPMPPPVRKKYCAKCAYQEFCWGGETADEG